MAPEPEPYLLSEGDPYLEAEFQKVFGPERVLILFTSEEKILVVIPDLGAYYSFQIGSDDSGFAFVRGEGVGPAIIHIPLNPKE